MFNVSHDDESGLITCMCQGFLTVADVYHYQIELKNAVPRSRARFGYVRILVLSLDSCIQSTEVMEAVGKARCPMSDPRDRMAVVVSSSLAKMQAARVIASDQERTFLSKSEAMAWLMADQATAARHFG